MDLAYSCIEGWGANYVGIYEEFCYGEKNVG